MRRGVPVPVKDLTTDDGKNAAAVALGRVHKTLGATPAMAAGLVDRVLKMADVVGMIDARETLQVRGPYKKKPLQISN